MEKILTDGMRFIDTLGRYLIEVGKLYLQEVRLVRIHRFNY